VEDVIMGTEFPGFSGPSASTEAPLEMLAACHLRIERQCATLGRLAPHVAAHGADEEARGISTPPPSSTMPTRKSTCSRR
jgi:hypothetical protein